MVVEIDAERERIGLSLRRLQSNPWETIDQRYSLGQIVSGPVTNVAPFGAFVQIEEAVEGLIHASELDVDPQAQPRDLLQPGQTVTAKIISLDKQRQRMGLSLRRVSEGDRGSGSAPAELAAPVAADEQVAADEPVAAPAEAPVEAAPELSDEVEA